MEYTSVGVFKASDPLDKPFFHGRDPWFDFLRVSDAESIATYVGRDELLTGVITPLELRTYEWSARMIFLTASLLVWSARWGHGHYYRNGFDYSSR